MNEGQIALFYKDGNVYIKTKAPFNSSGNIYIGTIHVIDKNAGVYVYLSKVSETPDYRFNLPSAGTVRVGRAAVNDIIIKEGYVSGKHFSVNVNNGVIRIDDLNSTNGIYVNGKRISSAFLNNGDVINILTIRITLRNNALIFENVGDKLSVISKPIVNEVVEKKGDENPCTFRLSPRMQKQLPQEPIVLDRPPKKGQEYYPSNSKVSQLLNIGAMAGSSLLMGAFSPALAFARSASLAAGIYNMARSGKIDKQRKAAIEEYNKRRDEEYRTYIDCQKIKIYETANEQREIITEENPEPSFCIGMLKRFDRRIWERRIVDRDFLDVRIGMGYEDICVPIKNYAENRGLMMEDDELEALCNSIAEENKTVDYIPRRLSLLENQTIGIIGQREKALYLLRNMIVSLTTLHSAKDVRIVGIFDKSERGKWSSLRWLPHVWASDMQFRYIAFDKAHAHSLCELVYDELKQRVDKTESNSYEKNIITPPYYIVIFGNHAMVENEPLVDMLSTNNKKLCASAFFLFDDAYHLPRDCNYFIDVDGEFPSDYDRYHYNQKNAFSFDNRISSRDFSSFARNMAAIELLDSSTVNSFPSSISFMEGFGVKNVAELDIIGRWRKHYVCDSLATPLGVLQTGAVYNLDIHYKAHGAHGLLAGTTGSGKSELLRTWILSMAVNYHPHVVNFVVIDYKGGGMANKLEALPHIVGKITNIDSNINRSLVSLKQETKRRMKLLENFQGVDDIDQYMKLYYQGKVSEPMPHLIIVTDEFAELQKEEPEFMKELNSIARVGRSVGVHLILATQNPSGLINPQIDSNSRFRICMKVNGVQESKEIIKRPDAAGITQRGRAYVRIGEDEEFSLIQSFWSGAAYSEKEENPYSDQVRIIDVNGERIRRQSLEKHDTESDIDQITAIVQHICMISERNGICALEGPFKPPLPEILPMHSMGISYPYRDGVWLNTELCLTIPVGMYDNPSQQEQGIKTLNFEQTPHYAVYGSPMTGKTTLLRTMILNLVLHNSPDNLKLYILDFGEGSLSVFEKLPHVLSVIKGNEEEKLQTFTEYINKETESRKKLFMKENVSNYYQYISKNGSASMPAIFMFIDNQIVFSELSDVYNKFLIDLSSSGAGYGIHIVFTSNNPNKTNHNIKSNISGNIALNLTDRSCYSSVVSKIPDGCSFPVFSGRAIVKDTSVFEFQTAVYRPTDNESENTARLNQLIDEMYESCKEKYGSVIKSIPDTVTVEDMVQFYELNNVIPAGINYENYEPEFFDLSGKNTMIVSAYKSDESTRYLAALIKILNSKADNRVYIFDGRHTLSEYRNMCAGYADDCRKMSEIIQIIGNTMQEREEILYSDDEVNISDDSFKPYIFLIINKMRNIADELDDNTYELFTQIYRNTENLGTYIIGAGTAEEICNDMMVDDLTISMVDSQEVSDFSSDQNQQTGIAIGGKINNHSCFKMDMYSFSDKLKEIVEDDGIIFNCGKSVRIKLMK